MNERILIVDDTPENIQIMIGFLKETGYQLSVATNGQQVFDLLERLRPDLILLDVMMPEPDGFEICRRIKNSKAWQDIPIIFLTGKTETSDIVTGFELGAVDYVPKPFNSAELLARINTHLTMDQLRRSLAEKNEELARAHKREMEMAFRVQSQLLPLRAPEIPGWQFAAIWQPAREVSGDYYDFIRTDDRLGLITADVSGKGMPAALFMATARSVLRAKTTTFLTPAESLTQANTLICADAARGMFITVFYAEVDPATRAVTYVNCGHNSPFWYRAREQDIQELNPTNSVMGFRDSMKCSQEAITMHTNDLLLLYTDGITEAFNESNEQFGEERLKEILAGHANKTPQEIVTAITSALDAYVGQAPQSDDRTIVIAKCL